MHPKVVLFRNHSLTHTFLCFHILGILTNCSQQKYQAQNFIHALACNFGQNICRLFHVLAQFLFTTVETEL